MRRAWMDPHQLPTDSLAASGAGTVAKVVFSDAAPEAAGVAIFAVLGGEFAETGLAGGEGAFESPKPFPVDTLSRRAS
jgi:hypothetical protein